ncbi:hypothetical protein ZIOFF_074290 (mitochondrion) [Zingiber officinale]|uniref:Uncharacterized protein n=1 Tax=Zingiber officinale TaxID=94328 RepID=A0A8J5BVB9_ZINOF|nr:hypothetical protein ZIOFF_074515 [Zingiber officinale]KAG6467781.1 hypothetical protein ZIOFF_074290 [Zingiber officinale]
MPLSSSGSGHPSFKEAAGIPLPQGHETGAELLIAFTAAYDVASVVHIQNYLRSSPVVSLGRLTHKLKCARPYLNVALLVPLLSQSRPPSLSHGSEFRKAPGKEPTSYGTRKMLKYATGRNPTATTEKGVKLVYSASAG